MARGAFFRVLTAAGFPVVLIGMFIGSLTEHELSLGSFVSMGVIAIGAFMVLVGISQVLTAPANPEANSRNFLPEVSIPLLWGGFVGLTSLIAGAVAGYYIGRNEGFITFIFAFVVANLLFGLPLALSRTGTAR